MGARGGVWILLNPGGRLKISFGHGERTSGPQPSDLWSDGHHRPQNTPGDFPHGRRTWMSGGCGPEVRSPNVRRHVVFMNSAAASIALGRPPFREWSPFSIHSMRMFGESV